MENTSSNAQRFTQQPSVAPKYISLLDENGQFFWDSQSSTFAWRGDIAFYRRTANMVLNHGLTKRVNKVSIGFGYIHVAGGLEALKEVITVNLYGELLSFSADKAKYWTVAEGAEKSFEDNEVSVGLELNEELLMEDTNKLLAKFFEEKLVVDCEGIRVMFAREAQ
jgi:hypothetical protein